VHLRLSSDGGDAVSFLTLLGGGLAMVEQGDSEKVSLVEVDCQARLGSEDFRRLATVDWAGHRRDGTSRLGEDVVESVGRDVARVGGDLMDGREGGFCFGEVCGFAKVVLGSSVCVVHDFRLADADGEASDFACSVEAVDVVGGFQRIAGEQDGVVGVSAEDELARFVRERVDDFDAAVFHEGEGCTAYTVKDEIEEEGGEQAALAYSTFRGKVSNGFGAV